MTDAREARRKAASRPIRAQLLTCVWLERVARQAAVSAASAPSMITRIPIVRPMSYSSVKLWLPRQGRGLPGEGGEGVRERAVPSLI